MLQQLGTALNAHRLLRVHTHGLIALDQESPNTTTAQEKGYERQTKRGSATRSWEGSARRQRTPRGSRSAGAASRIRGNVLRAAYEGQVTSLAEAYPTLQTFPDDDGLWLLARSSIIPGLAREAIFLVALPYSPGLGPRAWAFWAAADADPKWIGPRHTNFQDGSICAFSPNDGAWAEGGDLRTLLDLYSVWTLRHLYLDCFGRWPGKQYGLFGVDPRVAAFYRRIECEDDELCGCGSETRRYANCCKPADLQLDFGQSAALFLDQIEGGFASRVPPPAVVAFMEGLSGIPPIADVHIQIKSA